MNLESVSATDFCVLGNVKVRLANRGLVFVCGENRDTNGADNNGSGKTTIFKSITWCLFEECVDGDKGDDIIRRGCKLAEVVTKLRDGNVSWFVTRSRTKGKPKLEIDRKDAGSKRRPVEGGKKELQELIHKLIGLDFRAFVNTVLYGANDSHKFANPETKDADRKNMLHSILRTSSLTASHRKALDRQKAVKAEIDALDVKLGKVNTALTTIDLAALKARISGWKSKNVEEIETSLKHATEFRDEAAEIDKIDHGPAIKPALDALEKAKGKRDASVKAGDILEGMIAKMDASRTRMESTRRDMDKVEGKIERIDESTSQLDGDTCPTCYGDLKSGDAKKHIQSTSCERERRVVALNKLKSEGLREKLIYMALKADKGKIMAEVKTTERLVADVAKAERLLAGVEMAQERDERKVSRLVADASKWAAKARTLGEQENPHIEAYDVAKTRVKELKFDRKKLKSQRADEETMLAYVKWWVQGFSNKGLPSYILDGSMPRITKSANRYLRTLADGDITMDFQTQRLLKSDKTQVRDDITITTTIEGNEGVKPSTGQLTKMNLATGLGLMDLSAEREGGHLDLLLIDEVLDGLDAEGTERVLALLQKLRRKRGSIFVISHGAAMSEIFEHGLRVVKEDGAATVRKIA